MQDGQEPGERNSTSGSRNESQGQPGTKRQRYVAHACTECKKRKVRCSGDEPCSQCADNRATCEYVVEPRKRRQAANTRDDESMVSEQENVTWREELQAQLSSIAADLKALKAAGQSNSVATGPAFRGLTVPLTPESGGGLDGWANVHCYVGSCDNALPRTSNVPLDHSGAQKSRGSDRPTGCWFVFCSSHKNCYLRELGLWDAEIAHLGIRPLQDMFHTYFTLMHPHYPCLDEAAFREGFFQYACNPQLKEVTLHRIQLVVLAQLIIANVKILNDFCYVDDDVPGWQHFLRAQHLTNHIVRNGKADVITIQCLLLISQYLLYVERPDWAYDEIGTAVRLVFKFQLHDQSKWISVSDHDASVRKRLFYCVYTLERNISHHIGAPNRIHDSDIGVDLPQALPKDVVDDLNLSSVAYLLAAVKWARLLSEVQAALFSPNSRPLSQEFIAMTEARVMVLLGELPEHLQWSTDAFKASEYEKHPHYIVRQAIVMHLRANSLRLLLRARDPCLLKKGGTAAKAFADAAASTIDAMYEYHFSHVRRFSERYPTVTYLPQALAALTTMILNPQNEPSLLARASSAFEKGVQLLGSIAPGFALARRVSERLQDHIKATTQRIAELNSASSTPTEEVFAEPDPQVAPPTNNDMNYGLACDEIVPFDGLRSSNGSPSAFTALLDPVLQNSGGVVG